MIDHNPIDSALFAEVSRLEWKSVERDVRAAAFKAHVYPDQSIIVSDNTDNVILNNLYNPFVNGFLLETLLHCKWV